MDPLSITASVIAIIQISSKIVSVCSDYIRDVKDAPSDLQKIMLEVAAVKGIFEALSLLLPSTDEADSVSSQQNDKERPYGFLRDSIDGCARELSALEALFPKAEDRSHYGKRRKCQLSLLSLAWPLKAHRAKKHLDDISLHKATITLALTTRSCMDISNMTGKIERIQDTLSNKERQDILTWLVVTDPSSNHNKSCDLHEPHTGTWLTRSPEYADWKNGLTRFLWLHGIPGAGKTILASFVFEDVKAFCKNSALESTGWAYYYCYFGHNQDETPHLLRWVINQLCRQMNTIPDEVRQLFLDGGSPPTRELIVALGAVLRNYHRVYLVIDALDESLDRERILNLLIGVLDDHAFDKLQLLALSREEVDIERALLGVSVDISLSNSHVDEDIRVYIQNTLRDNHKFCHWPEQLREEIETALVKGAKGMFRWVFCQLDILKRLNTIPEIRKALSELPRTLDETYERILCSIPIENRSIALRTFQLLAFDFEITYLGALLDALAVDVERCTFSRENRVLDPEALLEVCTCLITITQKDDDQSDKNCFGVQLAHYTVKEYLVSERIGRSSAATFQISQESAYSFAAKCFITYMVDEDYQALPEPQCSDSDDPIGLMNIAMNYWTTVVRRVKSCVTVTDITSLILKLLDVTSPHFQNWVKTGKKFTPSDGAKEILEWTVTPGGESCLTLVYLCYFDFFEAAQQFVENLTQPVAFETEIKLIWSFQGWAEESSEFAYEIEDGKLLHIAAAMGRISFVDFFIAKGANVNAISARGLSVLGSAVGMGWFIFREPRAILETVKLLLQNGANPNLIEVSFTPLQKLMFAWSKSREVSAVVTIAKLLLDFGADVNGVCNDESNIASLLLTIEDYCLQPSEDEPVDFDFGETAIRRHTRWTYDSPLRIVCNHMEMTHILQVGKLHRIAEMKEFLISRRAKSVRSHPGPNLLLHLKSRIEERFRSFGHDVSSPTASDDSGSVVEWEAESSTVSQDSIVDVAGLGHHQVQFEEFEAAPPFPVVKVLDHPTYTLENLLYKIDSAVSGRLWITGSITLPGSANLQRDSIERVTLGLTGSITIQPSENFA